MARHVHVGNLGTAIDDQELKQLFARHGSVQHVRVSPEQIGDGWVEMASDEEAAAAIAALNGREVHGRVLTAEPAGDPAQGGGDRMSMFKSANGAEQGERRTEKHDGPGPKPGDFGDRGGN